MTPPSRAMTGTAPWRQPRARVSISDVAPLACAALALVFACTPSSRGVDDFGSTSGDVLGRGQQRGRGQQPEVVVYTSEGEALHTQALDERTGQLALVSTVTLPERVQYAVADRHARFLYVSSSNGSDRHGLYAFSIDAGSGQLVPHGASLVPPGGRIVHLSIDPTSRHLILAHNQISQLASVRLNADGSLAEVVAQPGPTSTGFFTHQALIDRAGTGVVACGLGAGPSGTEAEKPGSLTVFELDAGVLSQSQQILLGGLGPRHLDYLGDRVFVSAERGNRLLVYGYRAGVLSEAPLFDVPTLINPSHVQPGQRTGAIHAHPSASYIYLSNRANQVTDVTVEGHSESVFLGGENNIALFRVDERSGEPTLIDHYDTHGFEARTFSIEPHGRFLIAGNQVARSVLDSSGSVQPVPRSVAVFRILGGGELSYLHKYDFAAGDVFWVGSVALPTAEAGAAPAGSE